MHGTDILRDLAVIFLVSIIAAVVLRRLRQSAMVGYILAGMVIGPTGFGIIRQTGNIDYLAELGVLLLLFTIGLEFSFQKIRAMSSVNFGAGMAQVAFTVAAGLGFGVLIGLDIGAGIYLGCIIALSSTAVVLKILRERGELSSVHGRVAIGILIFQDLAVLPMTVLLSGAGKGNGAGFLDVMIPIVRSLLFVLLAFLFGRFFLNKIFAPLARLGSREVFLLAVLLVVFGTVWLARELRLSVVLGAFLAGLILSETDYADQALGDVSGFRDALGTVFFVSIGMLASPQFIINNAHLVILVVLLVILGNILITGTVVFAFGYPLRIATLVCMALAQIGEFSFILAVMGMRDGVLTERIYQTIVSASVLTMLLTPALIQISPRVSMMLEKIPVSARRMHALRKAEDAAGEGMMRGHTVICGYGLVGNAVTLAVSLSEKQYVVLDLNPANVTSAASEGIRIRYGDASYEEVLLAAHIRTAELLVITVPDRLTARLIVRRARALAPGIHIIVRTQFALTAPELYAIGANDVILDEQEAGLTIAKRVLRWHHVDEEELEANIQAIRLSMPPGGKDR